MTKSGSVIFEVLTAVMKTMLLFSIVTPCRLAGGYQRFGETYSLQP
jgi:hypothetical protein